ncbi:MAG: hypothetical protein Q4C41_07145 [Eggerthellaceae bacterium]|nr:hypothetical protein [Eggerthellaceae bacterium]
MDMSNIVERLDNVDVRAPREFSRTVSEVAREQGRIDWRVRNSENMKKMKTHTINDIYQS